MDDLFQSEDFEEWDGRSPFWMHCAAGSLAGVVEHTAVYPLDTVRTHIQVCASCVRNHLKHTTSSHTTSSSSHEQAAALLRGARSLPPQHHVPTGMWQTIRYLMNEPAAVAMNLPSSTTTNTSFWRWTRLWRGVQAIVIGCIPAHALYFSSYEMVKAATLDQQGNVTTYGSSLSGAAAVLSHDIIMTPLDTMKQRLQLGHYQGITNGLVTMARKEGWRAFYRSFPITLATNIPYGMVMVSTHEAAKQAWATPERPEWQTVLMASSVAGCTAAALTTPLDRIKTALQTQELAPACWGQQPHCTQVKHHSWQDAARYIFQQEGWIGFGRGLIPRVMSHTPAVAISWTTYETAKRYLLQQYCSA